MQGPATRGLTGEGALTIGGSDADAQRADAYDRRECRKEALRIVLPLFGSDITSAVNAAREVSNFFLGIQDAPRGPV